MKELIKTKLHYLSRRLFLCACAGLVLLVLYLGLCWKLCAAAQAGPVPVLFAAAAAVGYILLILRLVVRPYQETRKIYEQFAMGYVLNDFFHQPHPLTPESELAIARLDEIIDRNNLIHHSKKQAEYLALQNQINPHFLYNTLEGIRSEALIAGLDSVAEMTEALATFFRYTISQVENLVTLEDELANIENYYYIQQFRFGDKLGLRIEYALDDAGDEWDDSGSEAAQTEETNCAVTHLDVLSCRLPKLTLQPIVENAIYHGIERKTDKGNLVIRIEVSDLCLRIRVSDDGLGMDERTLCQLNEKLRRLTLDEETPPPGKRGGIALMNVNNRIKLLFGENYGLAVYSREGVGTDVVVSLPLIRES